MRRIFKAKQIEEMLSDKDKVFIGGLPFSGKTTLINKFYNKHKSEEIQFIELPKKFNSINELNEWKNKIKEIRRGIIEGRTYVIELLLGKVSIVNTPSLQSPYLDFRGNAVSMKSIDAIKRIYKNGIKDDKAVSKILMYSTIAMPNYFTVIPKLVNEGIELYKQGKLDKILEVVLGVKRLYSSFPKIDISGEDSITYALGSVLPRDIDFKTAWSELSETWKELIYYRLDSALRLLPGSAEKIIGQKDVKPLGDKVDVADIEPFFVDLAEWGKSIILDGNNLCIVGPLRSAKSSLANYIYSMVNSKDVSLLDYNNYDLLNLDKKIKSESKKYIAVLTDDIFYSIPAECKVIESRSYIKDFIDYLYLKNNVRRVEGAKTDVPIHYYYLYKLKYNMSDEQIYNEYKSDMNKYIINTIFGNNKELINNYLPLLIVGKKYLPLPVKVSEIILNKLNKQIDKTFINWFSVFDFTDYEVDENGEIKKAAYDAVDKVREELIRVVKENKFEEDLLKAYFDAISTYPIVQDTKIDEFIKTGYGDYSLIAYLLLYTPDIIYEFNWDLGERVNQVCSSLKSLEDIIWKDITSSEDIIDEILEEVMNFAESKPSNYASIYEILSSENVNIECLRKAFNILKWYISSQNDRFVFTKFENKLYNVILKTKDDKLIEYYLKMSFTDAMRSAIYINLEHINKIAEISDNAKLSALPLIMLNKAINNKEEIDNITDPIEAYAALLAIMRLEIDAIAEDKIDTIIKYYKYLDELYDKFIRNVRKIDEKVLFTLYNIAFDAYVNEKREVLDSLAENKEFIDFEYGLIMFYFYKVKDDLKQVLDYITTLVEPRYNLLIKLKKLYDDDVYELFEIYKIKLAKTLITSKYDYKLVLQDIIDLWSKANIHDKGLRRRILAAYYISKFLLKGEVKKIRLRGPEEMLYRVALALTENEEMKKEFYKTVENTKINDKLIMENLDYTLENLAINDYLIPVLETYFYLKGDNEKLSQIMEYVEKEIRGLPAFILHKLFNEINVKGNRNKYIASLILFT
ncbi:hypothetical protein [Saccharolobus caldissimus]|uniref:Uncharacterized protein n=1 Tax=Saccharolobus caldissimus TaxID=1702097 RepID=A0AAQ4CRS9_9CREN|nr:hypothetical protein [Saccharolobus caldissimus]BDB98510.1 hypothetical protein SACC_15270 [Saccharolobus caldissimus]